MRQTDDNYQEAKSQQIESMLLRMAVVQFISDTGVKGGVRKVTWNPPVVDWEAGEGKAGNR